MEWDDLWVFIAVGQAGSLRKAAGALRLGQPTIGRPFHQLELSVGARLFERSANGHRLTREGQKLLPMAQGMADAAAAIDRRRAALGGDVRSAVRIVASEWAAWFLAPRLSALADPHGDLSEIEADSWLLVHPDLKAVPRVRHVMERVRGLSRPAGPTFEDSVRVP
jgi:DNA-binding transcriptional LysR family regulator